MCNCYSFPHKLLFSLYFFPAREFCKHSSSVCEMTSARLTQHRISKQKGSFLDLHDVYPIAVIDAQQQLLNGTLDIETQPSITEMEDACKAFATHHTFLNLCFNCNTRASMWRLKHWPKLTEYTTFDRWSSRLSIPEWLVPQTTWLGLVALLEHYHMAWWRSRNSVTCFWRQISCTQHAVIINIFISTGLVPFRWVAETTQFVDHWPFIKAEVTYTGAQLRIKTVSKHQV